MLFKRLVLVLHSWRVADGIEVVLSLVLASGTHFECFRISFSLKFVSFNSLLC